MSVLIKDIDMPKNHNNVTVTIWSNGTASYGLYNRGESLVNFRNVEAVPVQEHGRLIDADALKKILVTAIPQYSLAGCTTYADSDIMRWIDEAPTVISADEVV